jgi:hypothetical protein
VGEDYFSFPPLKGALSLLFAPGKGLVFMAPAALLALPWLWRQIRRGGDPLVGWTVLLMVVAVMGPICFIQAWGGAWCYGPRYILPLLPFLWIAVAPTLDLLEERRGARVLAYVLLVAGILTSLPGVLVDYPTHHDLATRAARIEWPGRTPEEDSALEDDRFKNTQYDWRFAAPWAHWRILRHRLAVGNEEFPVREIFLLDHPDMLVPTHERDRGFRHFAWIDFQERLGGTKWPAALICLVLLGSGIVLAIWGLDPDQR